MQNMVLFTASEDDDNDDDSISPPPTNLSLDHDADFQSTATKNEREGEREYPKQWLPWGTVWDGECACCLEQKIFTKLVILLADLPRLGPHQ